MAWERRGVLRLRDWEHILLFLWGYTYQLTPILLRYATVSFLLVWLILHNLNFTLRMILKHLFLIIATCSQLGVVSHSCLIPNPSLKHVVSQGAMSGISNRQVRGSIAVRWIHGNVMHFQTSSPIHLPVVPYIQMKTRTAVIGVFVSRGVCLFIH